MSKKILFVLGFVFGGYALMVVWAMFGKAGDDNKGWKALVWPFKAIKNQASKLGKESRIKSKIKKLELKLEKLFGKLRKTVKPEDLKDAEVVNTETVLDMEVGRKTRKTTKV